MKIGVVTADFNPQITHKMKQRAIELIEDAGHQVVDSNVPGAFDLVYGTITVIDNVDGVVVLGAIIKGETDHDQIIGHSLTSALHQLTIQHKKPIGFGVIGPGATIEQAQVRAFDHAQRAVDMVVGQLTK